MNANVNTSAAADASSRQRVSLSRLARLTEDARATGVFHGTVRGYKDAHAAEYLYLHARCASIEARLRVPQDIVSYGRLTTTLSDTRARMETLTEVKGESDAPNLVLTLGKNYLLDNGLAGSAYTAAFYMFLISGVGYSAIVAGDTQASHAGWLEAGGANAPTYSGVRKTAAWAAASAASKSLSAGLVFTFTGAGTVKGCGLSTGSVVDGVTGTAYSAGLFTAGDQPVVATNTLTVTYSATL